MTPEGYAKLPKSSFPKACSGVHLDQVSWGSQNSRTCFKHGVRSTSHALDASPPLARWLGRPLRGPPRARLPAGTPPLPTAGGLRLTHGSARAGAQWWLILAWPGRC